MVKIKCIKVYYVILLMLFLLILIPITLPFNTIALPIPIDDKEKQPNGNGCINQRIFNSSNVLGFWKLNENLGLNASDDSGNNNHGIVKYDNWTTGLLNNALNFSSPNDQDIDVGNIGYTGAFSLEFWVYLYENVSRMGFFSDFSYLISANGIYILRLFGVLLFRLQSGTDYLTITVLGVPTFKWTHFCLTFDGNNASNTVVYKNGQSAMYGFTLVGNPTNFINTDNLVIGANPFFPIYRSPNGLLDNIILYDVELTPSEVWSQYNNGNGYEGYPDGYPPIINQVIESDNPLSLGLNETITVFTCDYSGIEFVYFEIDKVNYSLELIGNNSYLIYRNSLWSPIFAGIHYYTIYVMDVRNNMAIYQNSIVVIDSVATILSFTFLFGLMFLELLLYLRIKRNKVIRLPLIATVFLFGIIINTSSFVFNIPFTPYIQLFLIMFESVIMILTCFEYYEFKNRDF